MAEKDPSIAHDARAIAEALGAETVIYVGELTPHDLLVGAAQRRVAEHKRARILAEQVDELDNIFGRHFGELVSLVDSGHDTTGTELTKEQREIAAKALLLATQARQAEVNGEPPEKVVERLSVWYWLNQPAIQGTRLAPVLRQLPEDYGIDQGVDFTVRGEIFREAQIHAELVHTRGGCEHGEC